jgi:hypothetical protein
MDQPAVTPEWVIYTRSGPQETLMVVTNCSESAFSLDQINLQAAVPENAEQSCLTGHRPALAINGKLTGPSIPSKTGIIFST